MHDVISEMFVNSVSDWFPLSLACVIRTCQPCNKRLRSTALSHMMASPAWKSRSFRQRSRRNMPKHFSSSEVDACKLLKEKKIVILMNIYKFSTQSHKESRHDGWSRRRAVWTYTLIHSFIQIKVNACNTFQKKKNEFSTNLSRMLSSSFFISLERGPRSHVWFDASRQWKKFVDAMREKNEIPKFCTSSSLGKI